MHEPHRFSCNISPFVYFFLFTSLFVVFILRPPEIEWFHSTLMPGWRFLKNRLLSTTFFSSSFTIRWPIHHLLSWINQITHGLAIRDVLNTRMYYLRYFILRIFGTNSLILVVLCCCPYFVGRNWLLPTNARLKLSWSSSDSCV